MNSFITRGADGDALVFGLGFNEWLASVKTNFSLADGEGLDYEKWISSLEPRSIKTLKCFIDGPLNDVLNASLGDWVGIEDLANKVFFPGTSSQVEELAGGEGPDDKTPNGTVIKPLSMKSKFLFILMMFFMCMESALGASRPPGPYPKIAESGRRGFFGSIIYWSNYDAKSTQDYAAAVEAWNYDNNLYLKSSANDLSVMENQNRIFGSVDRAYGSVDRALGSMEKQNTDFMDALRNNNLIIIGCIATFVIMYIVNGINTREESRAAREERREQQQNLMMMLGAAMGQQQPRLGNSQGAPFSMQNGEVVATGPQPWPQRVQRNGQWVWVNQQGNVVPAPNLAPGGGGHYRKRASRKNKSHKKKKASRRR
jgi:hypothetical protein